ncbi:hypothetical protein ACIP98_18575 [Streptomyces sp. NPDC088354]|uniref:hypothetical protein n=1 Tax=unclassified Streptomyces TaxID=2593676 RepID=UPI0029A0E7DE|nr:hypothetical protein [Streptomyces sp. MI02-7b]MDX3072687.1 hypothetical protein [Streptomyces sp. MI02-7b]
MRKAPLPAVLVTAGAAALVSAAALGAFAVARSHGSASGPGDGADAAGGLRVGATCTSDFAFATEVSCGLAHFGDVRRHCSGTSTANCPRTRSVTLKNTGRTPVRLVAISGSAPGERHETVSRTLPAGAWEVLGPRAGDAFLFDIVLRSDGGRATVSVTGVS